MTEWEKSQAGYLYDANYEKDLIKMREKCADLCYEFNMCRPSDVERQKELLTKIIGNIKGNIVITAPFANAVLDRLLHHSTVISIKGPSYRLKDKRAFLEIQEAEA